MNRARASHGTCVGPLSDGPQQTIHRLLHPQTDVASFNHAFDQYEAPSASSASTGELRAWWLRRMIETPHPLLEKITLFWHDHFAISNAQVGQASLMRQHIQVLRQHALGRFDALLESVAIDPAVFVCLNARANRKARPNTNLPRILMQWVGLDPTHLSEADLQETARAFTGWFVFGNELRFVPREHDPGPKTILKQEGPWTNQDVVRILLGQAGTPRSVVRHLYRWLISETEPASDSLISPLAEKFARDYDITGLVETILRSNLFFSQTAYRQKIKGPVEFALGIVRTLEGAVGTTPLGADLAGLGQDLYQPPTAQGWFGDRWWINQFTWLGRHRLVQALLSEAGPYAGKLDPADIALKHGCQTVGQAGRFLSNLFLQDQWDDPTTRQWLDTAPHPDASLDENKQQVRHLAVRLLTLPEFHLA
jgi:uncharacterized protein (DUF1800 family)